VAQVDVGTNGGFAWARPAIVPPRSDTTKVTDTTYNTAGWTDVVTNPRGIPAKSVYDNLGRVIRTIDAYTNGTPTATTDRTTESTFDGNGNRLMVSAVHFGRPAEKTEYVFGATTGSGNDINSNDVLVTVKHPDLTTGLPSSSTTQQDRYTVD